MADGNDLCSILQTIESTVMESFTKDPCLCMLTPPQFPRCVVRSKACGGSFLRLPATGAGLRHWGMGTAVLGSKIPGAAKEADRRVDCPAALVNRLHGTCEPACSSGTIALRSGWAAIASWFKVSGGGERIHYPARLLGAESRHE